MNERSFLFYAVWGIFKVIRGYFLQKHDKT